MTLNVRIAFISGNVVSKTLTKSRLSNVIFYLIAGYQIIEASCIFIFFNDLFQMFKEFSFFKISISQGLDPEENRTPHIIQRKRARLFKNGARLHPNP